jgi:hypothetical protein
MRKIRSQYWCGAFSAELMPLSRTTGTSIRGRAGDPAGQLCELDTVGGAGLVQQVGHVHADGLFAEDQLAGDVAVGAPGDDVGEDLPFAGG